jgi:hypothetical protein
MSGSGRRASHGLIIKTSGLYLWVVGTDDEVAPAFAANAAVALKATPLTPPSALTWTPTSLARVYSLPNSPSGWWGRTFLRFAEWRALAREYQDDLSV